MTESKHPADVALDLLLYAPLGLAMEARELLPKLVERGRQQTDTARVMGQFALQQGQTLAGQRLSTLQNRAAETLSGLGVWPRADEPQAPLTVVDDPAPAPTAPAPSNREGAASPSAASLAIPDYDSLSASQVVPRLAGLAGDELEAVRRYETATRGRKTILGKIGQLQKA